MIASLRPYPAMKDSGVEWLGKVPEHWEIPRGKSIFRCVDVRSECGAEELLTVSSERGVVPRRTANVTMFKAESYVGHKLCWPGDLVINSLWAWARGLGVSKYHGIISTAYGVYRPNLSANPHFIHELVRSKPFNWELRVRSKGVWTSRLQLTDDSFLRAPFVLPPLPEQIAIVRFLDHADRKIRRLIRTKKKLIKLLEEQKQAIIHRAVTRGLDPNVPLKPSGVKWFGDIPDHWSTTELRWIVARGRTITYGIVQPGGYVDGGRPMVRAQDYSFGWAAPENVYHVSETVELPYRRSRLKADDIVYTIVGQGSVGNVAIVPECFAGANITQTTARISPDRDLAEPRYVAAVLDGPIGQIQLRRRLKGVGQPGINLGHLRLFRIPLPPLEEQKEIAGVLGEMVSRSEAAISDTWRMIEILIQYRTRLIADVVTGKLDVRQAAAMLPDEDNAAASYEPDGRIDDDEALGEREIAPDAEEADA